MKHFVLISVFLFLSVKWSTAQLVNGDFEQWDTTYQSIYAQALDTLYQVPNALGGKISSWTPSDQYGFHRTTDGYSGNYSVVLHTWYNYISPSLTYDQAMNDRPTYLKGFYKYKIGENLPSFPTIYAGVSIVLSRTNNSVVDTIAKSDFTFTETNIYSPFEIPLTYISSELPDRISMSIICGKGYCNTIPACNLLYLDNLSLSSIPLGNQGAIDIENSISFFPNPVDALLTIKSKSELPFSFKINNFLGQVIAENSSINTTVMIDVSTYSPGLYFIEIKTGENKSIHKFLKK